MTTPSTHPITVAGTEQRGGGGGGGGSGGGLSSSGLEGLCDVLHKYSEQVLDLQQNFKDLGLTSGSLDASLEGNTPCQYTLMTSPPPPHPLAPTYTTPKQQHMLFIHPFTHSTSSGTRAAAVVRYEHTSSTQGFECRTRQSP